MNQFLAWLAMSPVASALKIGAAASLVWTLDNLTSLDLSPVVQIGLTAGLPVLINWLNSMDFRYGR